MTEFKELYQQLILDHNKNPRNFKVLPDANHSGEGYNPLCGDQLTVYARVENNIILEVSFQGKGCAISKASASIMTTILKGKTLEEAQALFERFHEMITTGETDEQDLGKLAVLAGVHKYPARVKCAALAWHTAINSLNNESDKITKTE